MYLKSIDVQGFKSFANKITFEFHNGITGIVGPNGSGKSNVADAVRWVLGEQSAKQLRGGNMQDVIFSGTETRKPLGFAYVAITLDNSDHQLPIDYEEVTVARRLYRSGESEYLLNGTSCRLKDVNELFYDTGIGKEGYSIIGQGQIDKILSGKPEERRELFDEAAGIVKFKRRKATALKKLEEEQQNLTRVNDILSELSRQLGPLERQSETAKIYLKKKDELKQLDINMFLLEMEHSKSQLQEIEQKYRIARDDLSETQEAFAITKTEYEKAEAELEQLDLRIEKAREEAGQKALMKQQLEGEINVLREQINTARMNDEHFQNRALEIKSEIEKKKEDITELEGQKADLKREIAAVSAGQTEKQKSYDSLAGDITELLEKMEEAKSEIIELLNQKSSIKGKLQRFEAMREQISIRKAELNKQILILKSQENEQEQIQKEQEEELARLGKEIQKYTGESQNTEAEIQKLQTLIAKGGREMEIGQTAYHREASRLESLKNLTERYDGYGNSIRRVMEQKKNQPGIKGVVADLIKVDKRYETAIETALGGSIQNIVADNENTAKTMISFLKKNRYGRATFLPLTSMAQNKKAMVNQEARKEPGVIGVASELVQAEPEYQGMIHHLLGRTLVVDHMDHGIAISKKYHYSIRMVTVEGDLLSPGGSLTGGACKNSSNLLGRRREIEELESSVKALKADMDQMQKTLEGYRNSRNALRDHLGSLGEKLQELYLAENTARMNMTSAEERYAGIRERYTRLGQEAKEIETQMSEIADSSGSIQGEIDAFDLREAEQNRIIEETQKLLEEKREAEALLSRELEEIHLEAANLSSKKGFLVQNLNRITEEIDNLEQQLADMDVNLEEGAKDIAKKERDISEIQKTIEAARQTEEDDERQMKEYLAKKEEINLSHKSFFQKRDELSGRMNLLDKECFRLNGQKEKLEEFQENQINYMWEEYEITLGQALENRPEELGERGAIKKSIAGIKDEIRKLGDVNVNAIEDYKNLLERHTFLAAQHEDLVKAEETLLGIIEELDSGMRKQFTEKFAQIQVEFDKAFKELFGGGKGTLELMEEEEGDVLEAGIRIISQPPGKKLQNMMQLSGGEKALTAIALLFAIQNLKPSPFCLLDEIEAALDDSNVTRYAQYLHKLTKNTQFIIITHRRGTMTAADRLYGITMQEKGISTLVSVNLIENDLDK